MAEHHGRPPRYAVAFTAYGWDPFIEAMYRRNGARVASGDMHIVMDESRGSVDVPPDCTKITATEQAAAALGLRIAYHRSLFWHNIDYLYYIFFEGHQDYEYYIFLDYDTYVNTDIDRLVDAVARRGIDFVGAERSDPIADWTFASHHATSYGAELDARISAVTVLSKRALSYLFERRRDMSAAPTPAQQAFWPLCEAFVPSELKLGGFIVAPLREFGDVASFDWWPPTLEEALSPTVPAGFVHPVLDRPRFIRSIVRHTKTRDFLRPGAPLWHAIRSCRDWRWIAPLASELVNRIVRRTPWRTVLGRSTPAVGMSRPD